MILLDVNVLVAAHRTDHDHHHDVRGWLDAVLTEREPFWVPDGVCASFVRIATHRRIFVEPTPVEAAFTFVRAIRAQPSHRSLIAGERHLSIFEQVCRASDAAGDLVPDAYLAALALEHNCEVASRDRDLHRFSGLRLRWPGTPAS